MAEANTNNDQGGNGQAAVTAIQAREALADFYPDRKILDGIPDDKVVEHYTKAQAKFKPAGIWADNWRQELAGDKPDALKTLERFPTPKELYQSYASLRQQRDSGELKAVRPFPDKGTAEEQSAWRKDNGVPEKPEDYKVEPPKGVVIGEADKPFVDGFLKHAHASNMAQKDVNASIAWWGEERVRRQEEAAAQTADVKQKTEDALRTEWGNDYRVNMNRIKGMVDATVSSDNPELKASIMESITQNADFAKHYAMLAFQLNPQATMTPGDGGNAVDTIEQQIVAIEKTMGTAAYTKDERKQAELRNLYSAYERLSGHTWDKRQKK